MRKHKQELLSVCRDAGLNPISVSHRGKHLCVECEEGRLFCPSTPSDRRYRHNLRSVARGMARNR
jgi:hypothetical protein